MNSFRQELRKLANLVYTLFTRRVYIALMLTACLVGVMTYVTGNVRAVYIRDGDLLTLHYTFRDEPSEVLNDSGINLMAFDAVDFTGFYGKVSEIQINRAYPVYLDINGETQTIMATGSSLGEILNEQGITVGPYDELSHSPEYEPQPGDSISLKRVDKDVEITKTDIPFSTQYRSTSLLKPGVSKVIAPGQNGILETTVTQLVVDGFAEGDKIVEERIILSPVDRVVLTGVSGAPVSNLDFGVELDENGKPVNYKYMLENQTATGYNAGKGAWGASGMSLFAGYVAVRNNEIPYGTKLYITSADGSFVYGFAIAADTGVALMNNIIDVDLYYDTYEESCLNGRRNVQIYVLE